MGERTRAMLGTSMVVGLPIVVIRLLHGMAGRRWTAIDFSDLSGWLARTSIEDAVTAIARLMALVLAYWLLASTLLYLASLLSGNRRLIRLTGPLTFPFVRRMADRVVAGSIVLGVAATPLVASTPAPEGAVSMRPVAAPVADGYVPEAHADALNLTGDTAGTAAYAGRPTTPAPQPPAPQPGTPAPAPSEQDPAGPVQVVVAAGDNLWSLAEARLGRRLGRQVTDNEVAPYWRAVVDANGTTLRSGDPDLIYPGETVVLPDPADFIPAKS